MDFSAALVTRIRRYLRQAEILRQIHSDKAFRAERASRWYAIFTVLVAAVLTLLGFAGPERLVEVFAPSWKINVDVLQAALNWAILAIVVLTVLALIYRFDERRAVHHRSIEKLTEFIRDVDDLAELAAAGQGTLSTADLDRVRERYKGIAATLPPSTDREYIKSKKRYVKKEARSAALARAIAPATAWVGTPEGVIEDALASRLVGLLTESYRLEILRAVREELGESFWVVGGFVRDPVWDEVQGHRIPTPIEDIDVVHFDREQPPSDDAVYRERLVKSYPNQVWSVTNEAHAHSRAKDKPYESLLDAIARFPESASAVAIRLDERSTVRVIAPYGLRDLFDGVVRVAERASPDQFELRLQRKQWSKKWTKLLIVSPAPTAKADGESVPSGD